MSESFLSAVAARQLDLRIRSDAAGAGMASLNEEQPPDSQPAFGVTDTGEVVQVDALSALVHQLIEQGGDVGEEGEEEGEDDDDDDDSDDDDEGGPSGYDLPLRLRLAAMNGDTSEMELLIAEGFAVDEHGPTSKATPLLVASEHGHHETVSVLCAAGAAVDHVNRDGDTALILAVDQGHVETASVLCAAGADVNQGDAVGRTPLFLAIDDGHIALTQLLASYGAHRAIYVRTSPLAPWNTKRIAVDMATRRGHDELAAWLTSTQHCTTPLHYLSLIGAARARDLIRDGADLYGAFGEGDPTPVSIAREMVATGDAAEDDGSAAALVLQAARPWSRDTHHLFPVADRARAVEMLIWGHRLAREPWFDARFPAMALLDVWVDSVIPHAVSRVPTQYCRWY